MPSSPGYVWKPVLGPGPWCGTSGGYSNHRCRCAECTEAWRVCHLDYMHRNPAQQEKARRYMVRYNAALRALRDDG